MKSAHAIPVTILSGFLGSGKSTLLNDFLKQPDTSDTAVVVNEFGDIAIDHDLIQTGQREMMVTTTGCLCCTGGSDVRASLFALHEAAHKQPSHSFSRVIVETTGLADPAPVVNQLIAGGTCAVGYQNQLVAKRFRLTGFVCVVDVTTAEQTLQTYFECLKQIAFADRIVLTKTDLARDGKAELDMRGLLEQIVEINPTAEIVDRHGSAFDIKALFSRRVFALAERGPDVESWLAFEQVLAAQRPHGASGPNTNRHAGRVRTFSLVEDEPIAPERFADFLALLRAIAGDHVLRMKGLVALSDDPARPLVAHAVQHVIYPPLQLERWPSKDHRTRLVLITRDLARETVQDLFAAVAGARKPARKRATLVLGAVAAGLIAAGALLAVATHVSARHGTPVPQRMEQSR